MLSALEIFVQTGREICKKQDGVLFVDFTRSGYPDYVRTAAPSTANGLGRCLPSPSMAEGAKMIFPNEGQRAEIYFLKSGLSRVLIRGENGRIITSGKGFTIEQFRAACDAANLDQRRELAKTGKSDQPTKVVGVFDHLCVA